jgi:hypothetical protein
MYKLEIKELNQFADSDYFNKWLKENFKESFTGFTLGLSMNIFFKTELNEEEKDIVINKYLTLTAEDVIPLEAAIKTYDIRAIDGVNFYNELRGGMSLEYKSGELDIKKANYIEIKLINVKSFLLTGDWATAQYQINNVIVEDEKVSEEDIENGFTQERYNTIKTDVDVYVKENY